MEKVAWIVDDDLVYQKFIISFLNAIGYAGKAFSSGEECIKSLSEKPDFIILDHNLGDEFTGMDTLRNIKAVNRSIPVIYLSAQEKVSLVSEAFQYGSVDYIEKDNASLLRLKLRIEKIEKIKNLRNKRRVFRYKIAAVLCMCALIAAYFFYRYLH